MMDYTFLPVSHKFCSTIEVHDGLYISSCFSEIPNSISCDGHVNKFY